MIHRRISPAQSNETIDRETIDREFDELNDPDWPCEEIGPWKWTEYAQACCSCIFVWVVVSSFLLLSSHPNGEFVLAGSRYALGVPAVEVHRETELGQFQIRALSHERTSPAIDDDDGSTTECEAPAGLVRRVSVQSSLVQHHSNYRGSPFVAAKSTYPETLIRMR